MMKYARVAWNYKFDPRSIPAAPYDGGPVLLCFQERNGSEWCTEYAVAVWKPDYEEDEEGPFGVRYVREPSWVNPLDGTRYATPPRAWAPLPKPPKPPVEPKVRFTATRPYSLDSDRDYYGYEFQGEHNDEIHGGD